MPTPETGGRLRILPEHLLTAVRHRDAADMDLFAGKIAEKVGDMVEGAVKNALGMEDKDEKKKEKGGFFSFGRGDDDEDEKKKKKNKEEDKGFFSKIFDRDDDEDKDKVPKKSGFHGLFAEGEGGGAGGPMGGGAMGGDGGAMGGGGAGGPPGQTVAVSDRDLFDDLMDVAEQTSKN
ncbi:glycine-rich RNA-binding protein 2, mitochondrial-like [Cyprinodon tularosa]|uniref:glycine-rich RNA-binding protein 2, mitochondrial-like n=1 Tax=Cyprinodon tularosa TaxID=77115 RepID=UPI0018E1DF14|nr:glycine-rich RNA-binding protein 2, mitochondrial-like [Cyprinodon tularosa]